MPYPDLPHTLRKLLMYPMASAGLFVVDKCLNKKQYAEFKTILSFETQTPKYVYVLMTGPGVLFVFMVFFLFPSYLPELLGPFSSGQVCNSCSWWHSLLKGAPLPICMIKGQTISSHVFCKVKCLIHTSLQGNK